jgi:hypothetical protein
MHCREVVEPPPSLSFSYLDNRAAGLFSQVTSARHSHNMLSTICHAEKQTRSPLQSRKYIYDILKTLNDRVFGQSVPNIPHDCYLFWPFSLLLRV